MYGCHLSKKLIVSDFEIANLRSFFQTAIVSKIKRILIVL